MERQEKPAGEEFLAVFSSVEQLLRRRAGVGKEEGFRSLIQLTKPHDAGVRRFADDLMEFAELRNAIVHDRRGYLLADPYPETVHRLQEIFELLAQPPRLDSLFLREVTTAQSDQPIGQIAQEMRQGNFSQMPVYDGDKFAGLLTADTIARWLAASLQGGVGLVEEAPVSDVLLHTEDPEHNHKFLKRSDSAFDALSVFNDYSTRGWTLNAVIITEDGKKEQKPLGIITTFDIPRLVAATGGGTFGM